MADEDPEDLLPTHFLRARGRSRDLRLSQAQDHLAFHEADSESGIGISTSSTLVESFAALRTIKEPDHSPLRPELNPE